MTSAPPLMACLHKYRNWSLFRVNGAPRVLKRWKAKTSNERGAITVEDREEWGDLDGGHMTDAARLEMQTAWKEFSAWTSDNAAVAP